MKFRKNLVYILISIMTLTVVSTALFYLILQNENKTTEAFVNRYNSYILADELRQTSDDLTRMSRTYVVTGDKRYKEYFQNILGIRKGEHPRPEEYHRIYWDFMSATGKPPRKSGPPISLKELMRNSSLSSTELALLRESERGSNELAAMENQALNIMIGNYLDDNGEYTISGPVDIPKARELLHSKDYHIAKANVMHPLDKFFDSIDMRTAGQVDMYRDKKSKLTDILHIVLGLSLLLLIISAVLISKASRDDDSDSKKKDEDKVQSFSFGKGLFASWPLLIATAIVIFLNISLSWWFVSETQETVYRGVRSKLAYDLKVSQAAVSDWVERVELEVDYLSDMISRHLKTHKSGYGKDGGFRDVRVLHDDLVASGIVGAKFLEDYILLDPRGTVLSSNRANLVGDYFKLPQSIETLMETTNNAVIFPQGVLRDDDDKVLTESVVFASNLRDGQGTIYFMISPEAGLSKIFRSSFSGDTGEIYMVNSKGLMLTDSRWKEKLVDKGWVQGGESSLMKVKVSESQHPSSHLTHSVSNVVSGRKNLFSLKPYRNYLGKEVLGFWSWDNTHRFGIVSEVEAKEALGFFRSYVRQRWVTGIFTVTLILALLFIFISNRVKMAKVNDELLSTYETIKMQNEKHAKDLEIGQRVQMDMLPDLVTGSGFALGAYLTPAQSLSGDFYDFGIEGGRRLYFCIGDVSGKGVAASLFMSMSKVALHRTLDRTSVVSELVTIVNDELSKNNESCMFVTLIVGIMELDTGIIDLVNAGHNPPYIKKGNGGLITLEEVNGPLVGSFEGVEYGQQSIKMSEGDTLFLYTDGVTEAQDIHDDFYLEERLETYIREHEFDTPQQMVNDISQDVQSFIGEANQFDDITIMALKYTGDFKKEKTT